MQVIGKDIKVSYGLNQSMFYVDLTGLPDNTKYIDFIINYNTIEVVVDHDRPILIKDIEESTSMIVIHHAKNIMFGGFDINNNTKKYEIIIQQVDTRQLSYESKFKTELTLNEVHSESTYLDGITNLNLNNSTFNYIKMGHSVIKQLYVFDSEIGHVRQEEETRIHIKDLHIINPRQCNLLNIIADSIRVEGSPSGKIYTTDARIDKWFPDDKKVMWIRQACNTYDLEIMEFPDELFNFLLQQNI